MPDKPLILRRGPRTPEGRAAVAMNALKHGLYSSARLLPNEDPALLDQLKAALIERFQPADIAETILLDQIVEALWRLERARRAETAHQTNRYLSIMARENYPDSDAQRRQADINVVESSTIETIVRYRTPIVREYRQALHELERLQAARKSGQAIVPLALDVDIAPPST